MNRMRNTKVLCGAMLAIELSRFADEVEARGRAVKSWGAVVNKGARSSKGDRVKKRKEWACAKRRKAYQVQR